MVKPHDPFTEKSVKAKANKREKKIAKKVGGYRQPMSGAIDCRGGDVITPKLLIDSKATGQKAFSLTKKDLIKISKEANTQSRIPAILLEFERMPGGISREWICVPLEDMEKLCEKQLKG